MTAETTAGLAPAVAVPGAVGRRWPAVLLGLGGLLTAVGGSLHPHDAQETLTDTLVGLLSSPVWGTSHLLILAGVLLVVAGLAGARRERLFPDQVRGWLTVAIVCWAIAVVELVPHLLAGSEHHALEAGEATPMLTTHVTLSVVTEPLLGLSIAALAVAVAVGQPIRSRRRCWPSSESWGAWCSGRPLRWSPSRRTPRSLRSSRPTP